MPLLWIKKIEDDIWVSCWKIGSDELSFLKKNTILSVEEKQFLDNIKLAHKKQEFLAARLALQKLCKNQNTNYQGTEKDSKNKPFLVNHNYHISISHTKEYAMAMLSKERRVGIDIEKVHQKIQKIALKVFSPAEINFVKNNIAESTALWTAKEAVYKLYGKKAVQMNEQITLHKHQESIINQPFSMQLKLENNAEVFQGKIQMIANYVWAYFIS